MRIWGSCGCRFGVGLVVALGGSANAADFYKATEKVRFAQISGFDWSGVYVGGHYGYTRGVAHGNVPALPEVQADKPIGSQFGGLQIGYNRFLNSGWLVGAEADLSFPSFLGSDEVARLRWTAQGDLTERMGYIGRLRGRVGHTFGNWMGFAAGGFAWSQARLIETPGFAADEDKIIRTRPGWTLGAGVETAISSDWSVRLEYLYDNFGTVDVVFPSGSRSQSSFDSHTLRVALNWFPKNAARDAEAAGGRNVAPLIDPDNYNIHGQYTFIGQGYPSFRSPYQGEASLAGSRQAQYTQSATGYIGLRLWEGGEFYVNPELMQGFGLSDVRGLAGFSNGEAQKSNFPMPRLNVARAFVRQTFGLGGEQETLPDGPNQLAGKYDISRITVTAGKFAVPDAFGGNIYANDPRTTFLNWNVYGNGSYDWTMDKLSWTWGAFVDFNQKSWAFRTGYFLLPTFSNDNRFDTHIPERGQYTAELELRYSLFAQPGKLRLFGWLNHGTMGGYLDALALPLNSPNYPDIALTRRTRTNYGIVASLEQAITSDLGVFSRATWSPGLTEILGWTDCSESLSFGTVLAGTAWGRPDDKIGIAGVVEGLSPEARAYFAAGGIGILIGDGQLNYRREKIVEAYYAYRLNKWSTLTADYQFIENPAYNADRGPVHIFSGRFHAEF